MLISFDNLTLYLLLIALAIFVGLAIKSHNIKSFQFQISVFISIYVIGEMVKFLPGQGIIQLQSQSQDLGFLIHVGSMIFFSVMIWSRYYVSKKSGKKMIEEIEE